MSLDAVTWTAVATLVALLAAIVAVVRLYRSSRRVIVFDAWADFSAGEELGDRGKSLADLLLFHIREIQNAHRRSDRELDLRNPYDDIPAFQQELDRELRAAVELHRSSRFVGPVVSLLTALVPTSPARLRGSIHRFGAELRVNVVLENARGAGGTPQWSGTRPRDAEAPDLIQDLAYAIYLSLARASTFTDPGAFRKYTEALSRHLAFGEHGDPAARDAAEGLYREALEREPHNPATLYNLGILHYYCFEHDRNEEAERCFRAAMAAAQGALVAQIHSALANVHSTRYGRFGSGDPQDLEVAVHHAHAALERGDGLDVVLKAVAYAHHQASERDQAEGLRAAADGRLDEGRRLARAAAGHRKLAVTHYRRAIAANPRYYTAHNNLGNLYLELAASTADVAARRALLRAAVALFKETMAIRPAYQHAYDNLANAYYELALLGDAHLFDHAERYYRAAIAVEPGYAEAENDLAMLCLTPQWSGRDEARAQRLHEQALQHAPDPARRRKLQAAFCARRDAGPAEPLPAALDELAADVRRVARRARRRRRLGRLRAAGARIRRA